MEDKVAHRKFNTRRENVKRLTAGDVHCLTQETLQAHFQLEREGCIYGAEDIWDVFLAAAVERTTVEEMGLCQMDLRRSSSARCSPGTQSSLALGTLAALALGSRQTAPGIQHGSLGSVNPMIAVY